MFVSGMFVNDSYLLTFTVALKYTVRLEKDRTYNLTFVIFKTLTIR